MEYNSITDINTTRETWSLRVRIVRMWEFKDNLGMILIDNQGGQIEAIVNKYLISTFIKHLDMHKSLKISNFRVVDNDSVKYRETNHPCKISFLKSTYVEPCDDELSSIPLYGFDFTSFSDISSDKVDPDSPIDAIGVIVRVGPVQSKANDKKIVSVYLKDLENNDMRCDLWNKYADKVSEYMKGSEKETVVMIIHGGKKDTQYGLCITNSYFATKIYINEDIDEIKTFREKYVYTSDTDDNSQKKNGESSLLTSSSRKRTNQHLDDDQTLQTKRTRLQRESHDGTILELKRFCDRIFSSLGKTNDDGEASKVEIPEAVILKDPMNPISTIVDSVYPSLLQNLWDTSYMAERMILCPADEIVDSINKHMLSMIPGEGKDVNSWDSESDDSLLDFSWMNLPGFPDNTLTLKVGVPVVLLKDIDQHSGLCTGTRLQITRLDHHKIEAKVLSGKSIGQNVHISKMYFTQPDKDLPKFRRRQFPIAVCFAMTTNQSQGQSFSHLGVYLPSLYLTYQHLYRAVSRLRGQSGLKILLSNMIKDHDT